jgi:recombination protein RecR
MRNFPDDPIERLIALLARTPGMGRRSARRAVLKMLMHPQDTMLPLAEALTAAAAAVKPCEVCGNLDARSPCGICRDPQRDRHLVCVVEGVAELWALERAHAHRGLYHVLGGVLSPLDGVGPDDLSIDALLLRAPEFAEIVLAVNATVEGQTTAHYITDRLKPKGMVISRLAHGVPVGGELDYLDEGTLTAAMRQRRPL